MRALAKPVLPLMMLIPLLSFILAFEPGPQMSAEDASDKASFVPELDEFYSKPTVESSATYQSATDSWELVLTEQASTTEVAQLTVDDDSGEVSGVTVSPQAGGLEYPTLDKEEAMKIADSQPRVQEEISQYDTYVTDAEYKKDNDEWVVHYWTEDGNKQIEIAKVGINAESWGVNYVFTGDQVGWQMARGDSGAYGKEANYWYVWGPMALVFALAFLRTDKLYSMRNLDVLAMLAFLVSHGFFRQGISYEAVLLWYPPLIYLLIRTLLMGFGIGTKVEKTSNFPTWLLFAVATLASGLIIGLNLYSRVIDVGYAGVVGADRILDGTLPYGNMPADVGTGDTYGPLNYLVYVPSVLVFGFSGNWDFLPAAHAVTITAFVVGALAMVIAGWRLSGPKLGAAMFLAWSVFPYTLYTTNNNANDIIVAAAAAIGLAAATSPLARGLTVTAGFALKLYPILLIPLWFFHDDVRRGPMLKFILGGVAVVVTTFWVLFLDGDVLGSLKLFYDKTLAFQGTRDTPWTIFTQVPQLAFLKGPLTAAVVLLAFIVAVFPSGKRTVRQLAAFSAAIVIAFQLTTNYWFYTYIIWFEPLIFLALLAGTNEKTALDRKSEEKSEAVEQGEQPQA